MEWKEKVELIEVAINQLIEERQLEKETETTTISSLDDSFIAVVDDGDDGERRHLLTKLLSQLETLKAEGKLQLPESSADPKELPELAVENVEAKSETVKRGDRDNSGITGDDIVKELKKVKKQNLITHCLLSAMIVLTVVWQFSEVTLILKIKDRVSHPFKSVGNLIEGMLKGPSNNGQEGEDRASEKSKLAQSSSLPGLKIPDHPSVELPDFNSLGNGK